MGDVVNLNKFRKQQRRSEQEKQASENRTRFGLNKMQKKEIRDKAEKAEKELSGKKLDDPEN
ncbi:DUF4169 family protein [Sneathiella sp. P13V-1]|uniref:DUF4169 family protein n=1 Tax=Sneathiella sp. P13V-1 TaxID=2697366 RepID=UPI00187B50AC|nr:DUF4169 family protein [Sneathiella sp. P13V-1]MBE7638536.1 DUF4169 family protein [Sneathiella sp. P13V-1]